MNAALWLAWHAARGHLFTVGRPYYAPVGIVAHCRCGHRRWLI